MTFLPDELYAQIEASMPIACVDFVPVRGAQVGLILRESPHGRVWCHLGGRIQRGETIAAALRRHARETIGVEPALPLNPQPEYVYEWFPPAVAPTDGTVYGDDPRKHAIGLSFTVEVEGDPVPRGEALDYAEFAPDALPEDLWPGCRELFARLDLGRGRGA